VFGDIKIGLALGGGAARGLAHIGVLKVLAKHKVPIHMIVGTSIGALVGGLYATTGDIDLVEKRLVDFLDSPTFRANRFTFMRELRSEGNGVIGNLGQLVRRGIFIGYSLSRISFISAQQFEKNMTHLLDDVDIETAQIPFAAVACDLKYGEEVLIRSGSLRRAVSASSAIPGVLPPVEIDDRVLVDGGWSSKVPILAAFKMGADAVIAVDISAELRDTRKLTRGYDVFIRANSITESILKRMQCRMADVLIQPSVGAIHWADFGRARECMELGAQAAEAKLEEMQSLIRVEHLTGGLLPARGKRIARYYMGTRLQKAPKE
jgi:NTE family protein